MGAGADERLLGRQRQVHARRGHTGDALQGPLELGRQRRRPARALLDGGGEQRVLGERLGKAALAAPRQVARLEQGESATRFAARNHYLVCIGLGLFGRLVRGHARLLEDGDDHVGLPLVEAMLELEPAAGAREDDGSERAAGSRVTRDVHVDRGYSEREWLARLFVRIVWA